MGNTIRQAVEERRKKLINKLVIACQDESKEQLLKLSLIELENMHSKLSLEYHPHSDMGSLRWLNVRKATQAIPDGTFR